MAGPFTHMTILWKAVRDDRLNPDLQRVLKGQLKYGYLGSVSPDLPYLFIRKQTADSFHHEHTQRFIDECFARLRESREDSEAFFNMKIAWTFGYVSHIIADVVIHPVVAAAVGPVKDPSTGSDHRECEMVQDAIIFRNERDVEIIDAEAIDLLDNLDGTPGYEEVRKFWSEAMKEAYDLEFDSWEIGTWVARFKHVLDLVEDGETFTNFTRHIFSGVSGSILYRTSESIEKNDPDEFAKYYDSIKLPTGGTGKFHEHGYVKAVEKVVLHWNTLYDRLLDQEDELLALIPDWDLDDGIDKETQDQTFWSA